MTNIEVYDEDIGKRLDVFISEREDVTRAFAQKLWPGGCKIESEDYVRGAIPRG